MSDGSMLESVTEWLWWDRLWLPGNLTWSDLEDREGLVYAKPSHLYATLPCALGLLLARCLFERYVGSPLASVLGIRDAVRLPAEPNHILEKYFCHQSRVPSQADVSSLCKKTSWSERRLQIWFRRRRNQERPGLRKKFREASWRCAFYFVAFIGGISAVYDKPWLYNLREVWAGFPKQSMLPSQYWYYLIEMGFYLSLLLSLTCDVKRKDFMEQVLHHLATLMLLGFSWVSNYIRVGTLVMATHDSADIFLEVSKMLFYLKWQLAANVIFMVFTLLFILTRLVILPFWLIHCTWVYPLELYPPFFGYYFFNSMLGLLQILHFYWAVLIAKMLYKSFSGELEGDERSDEEEDDSEEEENESNTLEKRNHGLSDKNGYGVRGRASGH